MLLLHGGDQVFWQLPDNRDVVANLLAGDAEAIGDLGIRGARCDLLVVAARARDGVRVAARQPLCVA
jgi:hypothetical protein